MYVLFAGAFPPPHYAVSVFLTSIIVMYLLQRCCAFRVLKRFAIAGLITAGLILCHFTWFWIDYSDRHVIQLIDGIIQFTLVGLIGTILGLCLGTFRLRRTQKTITKKDETHPSEPQV